MLRRTSHAVEPDPEVCRPTRFLATSAAWRGPSLPPILLDSSTSSTSSPSTCPPDHARPQSPPSRPPSTPPPFWSSAAIPIASPVPPAASPTATSPASTSSQRSAGGRGESFAVRELPCRLLLATVAQSDACVAAVCRAVFFPATGAERFVCLCEADGELSLVADEATLDSLPRGAVASRGDAWRAFEVEAPPETIEQPGLAGEAAARLAAAGVPLAHLSTWRGLVVLVPETQRRRAYTALQPGITIRASSDAARVSAAAATGALRTSTSRRPLGLARLEQPAVVAHVPAEKLPMAAYAMLRVLLAPEHERRGRVFACCIYNASSAGTPSGLHRPLGAPALRSLASRGQQQEGLSLVLDSECERAFAEADGGTLLERVPRRWRVLQVEDPAVGGTTSESSSSLMQPVSRALADNDVPVFFLCSARADYVLVPVDLTERAMRALQASFHVVSGNASLTSSGAFSLPSMSSFC
eukprot:m51a1_g5735 hypothetical protein (471) ;mRNA; f:1141912-1143324